LTDETPLTDAEWVRAREWEMHYSSKYNYAGKLVDPLHPAAATRLQEFEAKLKSSTNVNTDK